MITTPVKRPRIGDTIDHGRYGVSTVIAVHDHGQRLVIATRAHGTETVQRAKNGHWAAVQAEVA